MIRSIFEVIRSVFEVIHSVFEVIRSKYKAVFNSNWAKNGFYTEGSLNRTLQAPTGNKCPDYFIRQRPLWNDGSLRPN